MKGETNVVENLIHAVSILNKTDEYLENLPNELSECDSLRSDYEHLIENSDLNDIDVNKLFNKFKECLKKRRRVKQDYQIGQHIKSNIDKIKQKENRGILISGVKAYVEKMPQDYTNNILTNEQVDNLKKVKRGRGRPKKIIEEVK